jgi:hypothetical protein
MSYLRKTALVCVVWLTAAMTLVAGSPHFVCRCPDGSLKPYCLGFVSKATGSCCGGCRAAAATEYGKAKPKCCCCHQGTPPKGKLPARGANAQGAGCSRTLAQATFAAADSRTTVSKDHTSHALPALDMPAVADLAFMEPGRSSGQAHCLPPPVDRVIALQHLLI